jgi:hypothetical protein
MGQNHHPSLHCERCLSIPTELSLERQKYGIRIEAANKGTLNSLGMNWPGGEWKYFSAEGGE